MSIISRHTLDIRCVHCKDILKCCDGIKAFMWCDHLLTVYSHCHHSTASGVFSVNTSVTTGQTLCFISMQFVSNCFYHQISTLKHLFHFISAPLLMNILTELSLCISRFKQLRLPCFSSPQTWRTGYASLSVRVTSWCSPLPLMCSFFFLRLDVWITFKTILKKIYWSNFTNIILLLENSFVTQGTFD